jgi:hypothetical protein
MRRELLDIESVQFLKSSESVEDWTKVSALLLKPSKKKVVILTEEFSEISGKNLLEKAISGSAKFLTLKGFLEDSVFEPDEVDL